MKAKAALWYLGVLAACGLLVLGFVLKSWLYSLAALALALLLKRTNASIPLPALYQRLGITNGVFEGNKHEKNHQ